MDKFAFNGPPPPPHRSRGAVRSALRKALDSNPGEWATVRCDSESQSAARQNYYKNLGYEATRRGATVYVRAVSRG